MNHRTILRILLVMSIANAALSFFGDAMMALFMPYFVRFYEANPSMLPSEVHTMWEMMTAVPRPYYGALALLFLLSLAGCILMWKERRSGFHSYAIAQLLILALPLLFLGKGHFALGDLMFTLLFLLVYYLLLKKLDVFDPKEPAPVEENDGSSK